MTDPREDDLYTAFAVGWRRASLTADAAHNEVSVDEAWEEERATLLNRATVTVPVQPSEAMLRALFGSYLDNEGARESCSCAYRQMVAAASFPSE